MTDPYAMEPWLRSLILLQIANAGQRLADGPSSKDEWMHLKSILLGALNDIDRVIEYGNPGVGIDAMFSSDRPINEEAANG